MRNMIIQKLEYLADHEPKRILPSGFKRDIICLYQPVQFQFKLYLLMEYKSKYAKQIEGQRSCEWTYPYFFSPPISTP